MPRFFFQIFLIFLTCASLFSAPAKAGEEKPEAEEGKAKKGSTTLSVSEAGEIEANISALQAKIKAKEEDLRALITEKSKLEDKNPRVNEVVKLMASDYHEMRALQEDLEKQKSVLRFRFPERASESHKGAEKEKPKDRPESLERFEKEVKTDQKLDQTLKKIEKVYGVEKVQKSEDKNKISDPESTTPLIQK